MCLSFLISSRSMFTPVIYSVLACQYILLDWLEHLEKELEGEKKIVGGEQSSTSTIDWQPRATKSDSVATQCPM